MSLPEIAGHELQDLIGNGGCGAVYRAVTRKGKAKGKTGESSAVAVKVFSSMSINRKALAATTEVLKTFPLHRGVLPVLQADFDRSPYYAVMPLVGMMATDAQGRKVWQTPTLEEACGRVPSDQAWRYIYEVADALASLHKNGVAHGNLRPANILIEDDPESCIRITDAGQGWVGGIHHFELTDHFVHLCPEQAENPEGVFSGYGPSWDVYSFGVMSYRLLTGVLPRGAEAWADQMALQQKKAAAGLAGQINSTVLLAAVKAQPEIAWPEPAQSKWEQRRREIIERALDLNPVVRWADMREVVREFEVLESDYLLEDARERIVLEKNKQAARVRNLHLISGGLLAALSACTIYAFITFRRMQDANRTIGENQAAYAQQLQGRDQRIVTLTTERDQAVTARAQSEVNLQHSQKAVDQFLTQLLETPTGNQLEVEFSRSRLEDALAFCTQSLKAMESSGQKGPELVRTYGQIGRLNLQLGRIEEAREFLEKALGQAEALVAAEPAGSTSAPLHHQWLGRYALLLSAIESDAGNAAVSTRLLKQATTELQQGLNADTHNRLARVECARAWLEYGVRAQTDGDVVEAEQALARVPLVLDAKLVGGDLLPEEDFLLARATYERGLALYLSGKVEESVGTLIDAVQEMGKLVLGTSPRNQNQALMLAEAYTELAEIVGKHFSSEDAKEAHNQAVPILLELNRLHPEWGEVKYLLARNYGAISLLERDSGGTGEALKKKQDAIELINEVLADQPDNPRYRFLLGRLKGEYAELMSDLGKTKDAVPIVKQAVEIVEGLLAQDASAKLTPQRKTWEQQLAQLYGVLGHACESSGQKDAARTAFTSAARHWEKLAAAFSGDEAVQQGLNWTRNRLQKLK